MSPSSAGVVYQAMLRAELSARLPVTWAVSEHVQAEITGISGQQKGPGR